MRIRKIGEKQALQKKLHEYTKRRKKYQLKGWKVAHINQVMSSTRRSLKRIQERQDSLDKAIQLVVEFSGVDPFKNVKKRDNNSNMAKRLFYKYCGDNGIKRSTIEWYTGCKDGSTIYQVRKRFQQSFSTNRKNLETWNRFKQFIKEKENEQIQNIT